MELIGLSLLELVGWGSTILEGKIEKLGYAVY
jgi:hypothetical protein